MSLWQDTKWETGSPRIRRCMRVDLSEGLHRESVIPPYNFGKSQKDNSLSQKAQFSEPSGGRYEAIKWFFRFLEYISLLMVSPVYMYSEGRLGIVMRLG